MLSWLRRASVWLWREGWEIGTHRNDQINTYIWDIGSLVPLLEK